MYSAQHRGETLPLVCAHSILVNSLPNFPQVLSGIMSASVNARLHHPQAVFEENRPRGPPRRITKFAGENLGHGPKGESGILTVLELHSFRGCTVLELHSVRVAQF